MARVFNRFDQRGQVITPNFGQMEFAQWNPALDSQQGGNPLGQALGALGGQFLGKGLNKLFGGGEGGHQAEAPLAGMAGSGDVDRMGLPMPAANPNIPQSTVNPNLTPAIPIEKYFPVSTAGGGFQQPQQMPQWGGDAGFQQPQQMPQWGGDTPATGVGAVGKPQKKKEDLTSETSLDNKTAEEPLNFPLEQSELDTSATRPRVIPSNQTPTTPISKTTTEPELTGSARIRKELEDLENTKPEIRKGKFRRFGTGVRDAVMSYIEAGMPLGVEGLIGAALSGGIGSVFSPGMNAEMTRDRQKSKIMRRYGEARALETEEAKRQDELIKNRKGVIDLQTSADEMGRKARKEFEDRAWKDEVIDEDEVKEASRYGVKLKAGDYRDWDFRYENGLAYGRPKKGSGDWQPVTSLPKRVSEMPREYTSPSGNKYVLTQQKAAELENALIVGDLERGMRLLIANNQIKNENIEAQNKATDELGKFEAERKQWMTMDDLLAAQVNDKANELSSTKAQYDAMDKTTPESGDLAKKIEKLESDISGLQKSRTEALAKANEAANRIRNYQRPKNQQTINENKVPKLSPSARPSRKEAEDYYKRKYPKASGDQIQQWLKEAGY